MELIDMLEFQKLDFSIEPKMQSAINDVIQNLFTYKSNVKLAKDVFRHAASWTMKTWKNEYARWSASVKKRSAANDVQMLTVVVQKCFESCTTDEDIHKMRGCVPEQYAFFMLCKYYENIKSVQQINYKAELGCSVCVHGNVIKVKKGDLGTGNEEHKATVDTAVWDCREAIFVETKVSPERFARVEIELLRRIKVEMELHKLHSKLVLYTWGNPYIASSRLKDIGMWVDNEFVVTQDIVEIAS